MTKESLAYPIVAAIIESKTKEGTKILVQTRWKPKVSPKYTGLLEIPAGAIRAYENVHDTLRREIKEEINLEVLEIYGEMMPADTYHEDFGQAFRPFCCVQLTKGAPFVGFVFIVRVKEDTLQAQTSEVKDPQWMMFEELELLLENHPEKFFTLELGALKLYVKENKK